MEMLDLPFTIFYIIFVPYFDEDIGQIPLPFINSGPTFDFNMIQPLHFSKLHTCF